MKSLFNSIRTNDIESVITYLSYETNLNIIDENGNTPLELASSKGYIDIVKLLIKFNADVNFPSKYTTPLISAVLGNYQNITEVFLANEADPNLFCITGQTALHYAANMGNIDMLKLLINYGGKPDILSKDTEISLLHSAAYGIAKHFSNSKCYDVIEWLLTTYEDVMDPFLKTVDGKTPGDIMNNQDWSYEDCYDNILERLGYYITTT